MGTAPTNFAGSFVALVTPFKNGKVNEKRLGESQPPAVCLSSTKESSDAERPAPFSIPAAPFAGHSDKPAASPMKSALASRRAFVRRRH